LAKAKFGLDLFPELKVRPTHDVPMAKHTNKRDQFVGSLSRLRGMLGRAVRSLSSQELGMEEELSDSRWPSSPH
jgi:hypothetical protein